MSLPPAGDGKGVKPNIIEVSIDRLSKVLELIARTALLGVMLLTTADVILRAFGRPIIGTYELVSFGAGIIIGFSLPLTTLQRGHVYVDFLYQKFPQGAQSILHIVTRLMGLALFLCIGLNLMKMASDWRKAGEVSSTLQIPFYLVAYGIGFACLAVCFVLIVFIIRILVGGKYE
jgi:TRAP-type C4-dicarboxylate transport system permease small subunit